MRTASVAFGNQVTAPLRRPTWQATLNGVDRSADLIEAVVEEELVGSLPVQSSIVQGASAGTASLTFGQAAVAALHPLRSGTSGRGDTSLIGANATISLGFDDENLQQLSGPVYALAAESADGASGTLQVDAVDPVTQWRALVSLPAAGPLRGSNGQLALAPLRTSAVLTHIAHTCGVRISPGRTGAFLSIPFVGGPIAEAGILSPWPGDTSTAMPWRAGPFGPAWSPFSTMSQNTLDVRRDPDVAAVTWQPQTHGLIECWAYLEVGAGTSTPTVLTLAPTGTMTGRIVLTINRNGAVVCTVTVGGASVGGTTHLPVSTTGWYYIGACLTIPNATPGTATITTNRGGTILSQALTGSLITAGDQASPLVTYGTPIQALNMAVYQYASTPPAIPWGSTTAITPGATFPDGDLLWAVPDVANVPAWDLLREIAAAELATIDFTTGGLRYRTRAQMSALGTTPARDYTVEDEALELAAVEVRGDTVRNRAAVYFTEPRWEIGPSASDGVDRGTPSWKLDRVLQAPPGLSTHIFDLPQQTYDPTSFVLWTSNAASFASSGLVFCTSTTATTAQTTGLTLTATYLTQTKLQLIVNNTTGVTCYSVWPSGFGTGPYGIRAGAPAGLIYGYRVRSGGGYVDVSTADGASVLSIQDGDTWRQDTTAVTSLASALVADLVNPSIVLRDITVPGDPRMELGDYVRVRTASGALRNFVGRLVKIRRRLDGSGGLVDVLTIAGQAE